MKTAHFGFMMFACVALLCQAGYAEKAPAGAPGKPRQLRRERQPKPVLKSVLKRASATIQKPSAVRSRPIRPKRAARTALPRLSDVRHRGPNPAVISGSVSLRNRNTGVIDGTKVHRRV